MILYLSNYLLYKAHCIADLTNVGTDDLCHDQADGSPHVPGWAEEGRHPKMPCHQGRVIVTICCDPIAVQ